MIDDPQTPEERQQAWDFWIAERPENLRVWLVEHAPRPSDLGCCWRLSDTTGHYVIESFHTEVDQVTEEDIPGGGSVTVQIAHVAGPGSRPFEAALGVGVFGVPIEKLVKCGCRNFGISPN